MRSSAARPANSSPGVAATVIVSRNRIRSGRCACPRCRQRRVGEIGTLYQACSFHFVGVLAQGGRILVRKGDGTTMSGRQARRRFGSESVTALRALGVETVPVPRRARYFAFRGSARERKRLRDALAPLIKPYPKRR
jgi:hypothetical protein